VAVCLARLWRGEIISVDSMKIYRGMDIGTAKAPPAVRQAVAHHMIDVVDPWETFSLAQYLDGALRAEREIEARGGLAVFSGGTPLYARGLLFGIFSGPPADWTLRNELMAKAQTAGAESLHRELSAVDPAAAARLHPNDLKRVVRALEVARLTGRPISAQQTQMGGPARPARVVALRRSPEDLRRRIDERVERMIEAGLVDEARRLDGRMSRTASRGAGYKEALEYARGECSLAEAKERIRRRTWQVSRKQMTWLRGLPGVAWVDAGPAATAEELAEKVASVWDLAGRS